MKVEDAPPAGWYPDPDGGSRLRWWEGTDWSDRYRAPPTRSEVDRRALTSATHDEDHQVHLEDYQLPQVASRSRRDTDAMVEQVRLAARAEADRAAQMFGAQARAAAGQVQPLITQYTSRITRWIRILSVVAILLLIVWLAFQIFVEVTLFDWIGDRIDNITDNLGEDSSSVSGTIHLRR